MTSQLKTSQLLKNRSKIIAGESIRWAVKFHELRDSKESRNGTFSIGLIPRHISTPLYRNSGYAAFCGGLASVSLSEVTPRHIGLAGVSLSVKGE